jgi:hypothetical protein
MISPTAFHELISPLDRQVQKELEPHVVPNIMGTFMGQPEELKSQKAGRAMYDAFFGVNESIEDIKNAFKFALPGLPFPLAVSGRMLDSWAAGDIIDFLDQSVDFLIRQNGIYPSLTLISVQAGSPEKAEEISGKLETIKDFRDRLRLS